MIHCSGGGKQKCMKYVPDDVNIIKTFIEARKYVKIIQQSSGADDMEMYPVFIWLPVGNIRTKKC